MVRQWSPGKMAAHILALINLTWELNISPDFEDSIKPRISNAGATLHRWLDCDKISSPGAAGSQM